MRKARELGLDVVHVQFPDEFDRRNALYADQAMLLDYGDIDRLLPLARALHQVYPFQAAVSQFELGLLPAARINEALGLTGESVETVELLLDKWRMRRHLAAQGVSPVASAVGRSAQDVQDFVKRHGLPIIVKPIRESGSLAVFRIDDQAGVDAVADRFRALDGQFDVRDLTAVRLLRRVPPGGVPRRPGDQRRDAELRRPPRGHRGDREGVRRSRRLRRDRPLHARRLPARGRASW